MVHRTTQISQSQPPLTTKGSGDLGSVSSHKDPTPIGDAGCPWEWPPTDATPRDITLEGLPPPFPFSRRARALSTCVYNSIAAGLDTDGQGINCYGIDPAVVPVNGPRTRKINVRMMKVLVSKWMSTYPNSEKWLKPLSFPYNLWCVKTKPFLIAETLPFSGTWHLLMDRQNKRQVIELGIDAYVIIKTYIGPMLMCVRMNTIIIGTFKPRAATHFDRKC